MAGMLTGTASEQIWLKTATKGLFRTHSLNAVAVQKSLAMHKFYIPEFSAC